MKPSPQIIVYCAGIVLLGLFYGQVKAAVGGGVLFLATAIAYLVVLRLIGLLLARVFARRAAQ